MKRKLLKLFLAAFVSLVSAEIDSGGGKTQSSQFYNHGTLGSPFSTNPSSLPHQLNRTGPIDLIYIIPAVIQHDSNNNGLPDSWEQQYFASNIVDPNADRDGDGTSNRMEYIAGTDPTSITSVFRPKGNFSNSIYTMPIQTVGGRIYKIFASHDMSSWHLQQTIIGNGASHIFSFDKSKAICIPTGIEINSNSFFFRIEICLPSQL